MKGLALLLVVLLPLSEASAANIIFQNDLASKTGGDLVKIDQVRTAGAIAAMPVYVRAGQRKSISPKSVLSFRVSRMHGTDKADTYLVECDEAAGEPVIVKVLDVHSNHMPGGCTTTKTGFWTSEAGYVWKK